VTAGRPVLAKSQHLADADVQLHGAMLDVLLKISCHTRLNPQQKTNTTKNCQGRRKLAKLPETNLNHLCNTTCAENLVKHFLATTRGNRLRT